jgi:preprotein translocase subunit SecA
LRGYAQKDPKQEYKREAFEMFSTLLEHIKYEVVSILAKVQISEEEDVQAIDEQRQTPQDMHFEHAEAGGAMAPNPEQAQQNFDKTEQDEAQQPFVRSGVKVGRNAPCPCGSGKKYKQCHGKLG